MPRVSRSGALRQASLLAGLQAFRAGIDGHRTIVVDPTFSVIGRHQSDGIPDSSFQAVSCAAGLHRMIDFDFRQGDFDRTGTSARTGCRSMELA